MASRLFCRLLPLLACCLSGCGYETYLGRLSETEQYFAYEELKNQNLDREWKSKANAVSLRVPQQFKEIPAPPPKADEEGQPIPTPPEDDPRQPKYLGAFLPGLLGAWQTEQPLTVVVGNSQREAPAYLYVLSNWELRQDPETTKNAGEFHADLTQLLIDALGVGQPSEDEWDDVRRPSANGFVEQKAYTHFPFKVPQLIEGLPTEVQYYIYSTGDHQVALLFVLPEGYSPSEKLSERINLSLETLKVSGQMPGRTPGKVQGNF